MTQAERIHINNSHLNAVGKFKPRFSWCIQCAGFEGCYPVGSGPNFMDQDCYRGPMTENELARAHEELNDQ